MESITGNSSFSYTLFAEIIDRIIVYEVNWHTISRVFDTRLFLYNHDVQDLMTWTELVQFVWLASQLALVRTLTYEQKIGLLIRVN